MRKIITCAAGLLFLAALSFTSCSNDIEDYASDNENAMQNVLPQEPSELSALLLQYTNNLTVDASSLSRAISDIEDADIDNEFSHSLKETLLKLLKNLPLQKDPTGTYTSHLAINKTIGTLEVAEEFWQQVEIEQGHLAGETEKCYDVKFTAKGGVNYEIIVESNDTESAWMMHNKFAANHLVTIKKDGSDFIKLDHHFNFDMLLVAGAIFDSNIERSLSFVYDGVEVKANSVFTSLNEPLEHYITVDKDGSQVATLEVTVNHKGLVRSVDSHLNAMNKLVVDLKTNNQAAFIANTAQIALAYKNPWGLPVSDCRTMTQKWNDNAMLSLSISGTHFADIRMGYRALEDNERLFKPMMVFKLDSHPDGDYTLTEMKDLFGIDLVSIITELFSGGGDDEEIEI